MAQKDVVPDPSFAQAVRDLLSSPLALTLPSSVLGTALQRAAAAGVSPHQAAIRICHEHAQRVSEALLERGCMASDLTELAMVMRLDECAGLAKEVGEDLLALLPDLPHFVAQACFSDEFRAMISNLATWHGLFSYRWKGVQDGTELGQSRRA